ncbi:MAG TPA: universal stress protein [Solirubrobacteraceae bacterium]|nr:universal stress protein [Solirubrobacteraceae bacterium]
MFHNILVCVDGSIHADRALDEAIDLATAGNARLTLLTSIPRPPSWACTPATAPAVQPLAVELRDEAKATLRAAVDRVPQTISVTTILSEKPIREALMEQLRAGTHDLLVMGSRGRRAFSASVLGSVSHYALNHAGVPVLIIHAADAKLNEKPAAGTAGHEVKAPAQAATSIA